MVGERAGVPVFAPHPGTSASGSWPPAAGVGDPVAVAAQGVEYASEKQYDVVIVDTAGRLGVDAELMQQAADIRDAVQPDEILFVARRDDRPGRGDHRAGVRRRASASPAWC